MSEIDTLRESLAELTMKYENLLRASARFSDNTVRMYCLSPKVYTAGDTMISALRTTRTWTDRETGASREITMDFGALRTFRGYGADNSTCFVSQNKSAWRVNNFVPYIGRGTTDVSD